MALLGHPEKPRVLFYFSVKSLAGSPLKLRNRINRGIDELEARTSCPTLEKCMAIQGIIKGFANPSNLAENLILIGRNAEYVLIMDGLPIQMEPDLEVAQNCFDAEAAKQSIPDSWKNIVGVSTSNLQTPTTEVLSIGTFAYGDYVAHPRFSGENHSPSSAKKHRP